MNESLEYIESYFENALNPEERKEFEQRCAADESFAKEVAFYITTKQVLREELLQQKQSEWKTEAPKEEFESLNFKTIKRKFTGRWIAYAVAACLLVAISVVLFEKSSTPQNLANNYINNHYSQLSQTMDASRDSLQLGIAAYNNKDYNKALQYFEGVKRVHPENSDAKKYTGLTYLQTEKYTEALQAFDGLAKMDGLFSNGGDFFKAITLLERNKDDDKTKAKQLLQKVVTENEEGSEQAKEWLKKL